MIDSSCDGCLISVFSDESGKLAEEEKMQRLLADPILKPLLEDLCQWLGGILGIDIDPTNFTGNV